MDAIETVQHKGRYYKNILVKVKHEGAEVGETTTAAWATPWHIILIDARRLFLTLTGINDLFDIQ